MQNEHTIKNILIIFLFVLIFYLLKELSYLLIPLALAFLLALLMQPPTRFLLKRKTPKWLILPIITIITLVIFFSLVIIIVRTTSEILDQQKFLFTKFDEKVRGLVYWINDLTGMRLKVNIVYSEITKFLNLDSVSKAAGVIATNIGSFMGSFVTFALYYIFLLSGITGLDDYLKYVFEKRNLDSINENYKKIQNLVFHYIVVKTLINVATAVIVTIVLLLFGVKFAYFWGLLTFVLNYIPTFGSIISVLLPVLMGFIQFDAIQLVITLLIILMIIHFTIGNFIEPMILSNQLTLNTVTVLFGLVFWAYIWGVTGMILSVPLMVIIKLILNEIPSLSLISRIMGYPTQELVRQQ